jgi:tripartite ATP-independent transporter DctM subunit
MVSGALRTRFTSLENGFSIAVLALMTLLPLVEFAGRQALGRGITGSAPLVQHLTLWVALLGAALAARSDSLLALSTQNLLPEEWRRVARISTSAVAAGITAWLFLGSVDLVRAFLGIEDQVALGIPRWAALLALPAGFLLIAVRLIRHASDHWKGRAAAALGLLIPVAFTWMLSPGGSGLVVPAIFVIVAATFLGMPIFAALGGAALVLFWNDVSPILAVPLNAYELASDDYLPAIPLFTLGGYILAGGGAGRRLMRTFTAILGWMPGGLAIVVTLILAFFTPLTGASGVTILSMGGLLLPILTGARYPDRTSLGLVTVSGSIGLLLPPSLPVILYAVYGSGENRIVRMDHLFIGALVPGIVLILAVAGWAAFRGWAAGAGTTPFRLGESGRAVWESKWELLLPVGLLGGYFGGFFASLVEAAAFTVAYALIVECFIYRDLAFSKDLARITVECAGLVGSFFIILGAALAFNDFLVLMEVPPAAVAWVQTHIDSRIVFLLALNVLLIIVGALMDIYSAIFVIAPLIAPMGLAYGIDPVHLGVIFLANMELGYLMPPMGENLFLSAMRFEKPLSQIYLSTLPYVLILFAAVLLITYVPALTLWPVRMFGN